MATENYFRCVLGVVIVLTIAVTGYHRFKASQSREKISRKDEGLLFAFLLRTTGLLLFGVTGTLFGFPRIGSMGHHCHTDPHSVVWSIFGALQFLSDVLDSQ